MGVTIWLIGVTTVPSVERATAWPGPNPERLVATASGEMGQSKAARMQCQVKREKVIPNSNPFKVTHFFPIRDGVIERLEFESRVVHIKLDDRVSKHGARQTRLLEQVGGFRQAGRQSCQFGIDISVAGIWIAAVEFFFNAG